MTTYLPAATEAANLNAKVRLPSWRAPKTITEAEYRQAEDALDRAYQKKLQERVHDFVKGVDRAGTTVRPARRRHSA